VIGRHTEGFEWFGLAFDPAGERLVASDVGGTVRVWSLDGDGTRPERELVRPRQGTPLWTAFSPDGTRLVESSHNGGWVWSLRGPAIPEHIRLGRQGLPVNQLAFSPDGRWLVTSSDQQLKLWPVTDRYPRNVGGAGVERVWVAFSPGAEQLFATLLGNDGINTVMSFPLAGGAGLEPNVHYRGAHVWGQAVDPRHRFLVVGSNDRIHKIPLDGSAPTVLEDVLYSALPLSLGPSGRYLAVSFGEKVQVHDLQAGSRLEPEVPGDGGGVVSIFDAAGRLLLTRGGVVSRWDPASRASEILVREDVRVAAPLCDDRHILLARGSHDTAQRWVLDLEDGSRTPIPEVYRTGCTVAWDAACSILASGHDDGEVRVGPFSSEEPHLILGQQMGHTGVQVSPDGKWVTSRGGDGAVFLWPVPDLSKPPLHTLPYEELVARLKALTNLRAVPDEGSHTGYRIEPDFTAYRGWETVPTW
jgi:WD40 repeat protein